MSEFRVRYEPKHKWFVIEKKHWLFNWEFVDCVETAERAIEIGKSLKNPPIIWESKDE
jgi:hypothetical protein